VTGDGDLSFDHADWAMARVSCSSTARSTPDAGRYLSDLPWTSMVSGWGPAERDRSNGESLTGDGRSMVLRGDLFPKGIGVHAPADVRFALPAGCSQFQAEIGVDDETGARGSAVFEVWADGVRLYTSPMLTGAGDTRSVDLPLSGPANLWLVVTDGDGDVSHDHADWAMARVICP
ncbi:MAG: glycosyl hydrolase, partial [Luteitalea sp.]|nr:glycosyl hydrolase [Luteitalea sp.]